MVLKPLVLKVELEPVVLNVQNQWLFRRTSFNYFVTSGSYGANSGFDSTKSGSY